MKGSVGYMDIMEMTLLEKQVMGEFLEKQIKSERDREVALARSGLRL